jgi:glycosyltransferase involved in cell wall biosynthesis
MELGRAFPGVAHWRGHHVVVCNWRDESHPQAGGAELYCRNVAEQLHAAGLRVTCLTSRPAGTARRAETSHGTVVRGGGRFTVYLFALLWLWWHRRDIDGLVDSQNGIPFFSPLVLPRRTPVVLLVHHVHQEQFGHFFPAPVAALGRWLESRGSALVYGRRTLCAVSPSTRAQIRARLALRGPVRLAPPGMPEPPAPRDTRRVRAGTPRIVCVGRLTRQKRWHHLIEALPALREEIPSVQLHFVGDGEQRAGLERRAAVLGVTDAVVFHGRLPAAARDAVLGTAWITAATAPREGWGLSVMEAAAAGVPTVAYDVPGLRDTVRDGRTGWLTAPGDDLVAGLVKALRTMADETAAAEWQQHCRAWAARFTWAATAAHLLAALTEERERLRPDRRTAARPPLSDSCTVVVLPRPLLVRADLAGLRIGDLLDLSSPRARLLLYGADEADTRTVLARIGVDPDDRRVEVRLARHPDTLGWAQHPPCCREHAD